MSKQGVIDFLSKGGSDKQFRVKYDNIFIIEKFVEMANADGFDFTVDELNQVLKENADTFASYGNPPKKGIWLR